MHGIPSLSLREKHDQKRDLVGIFGIWGGVNSMAIPGTQIGGTYHFQGLCKGYVVRGYTPKIWPYMVQYLHFRILEFPLINVLTTTTFLGFQPVEKE